MPLQATSGAASYDAFGGGVPAVTNYIEDVFSTWLYTGNSDTQTITNGVDLSTKGGMVWIKARQQTDGSTSPIAEHGIWDTARGVGTSGSVNKAIQSNSNLAQNLGWTDADYISAFNTTGFTVQNAGGTTEHRIANHGFQNYVSWAFRKQPKFFDVVTYTGDGTGGSRQVAHNLGSTPGCVFIKRTDASGDWMGFHRGTGATNSAIAELSLNLSTAPVSGAAFSQSLVTSTYFIAGDIQSADGGVSANASGATYVAYLFAHNAGGFGLTGTDNVISCGSFTTDGSGNFSVNLGWEPQWVLFKGTNSPLGWNLYDNMRGMPASSGYVSSRRLVPNSPNAESTQSSPNGIGVSSTGFSGNPAANNITFIYIAIRRGPMKVPTSGTSVFGLSARTGTGANATVTGGSGVSDTVLIKNRGSAVASLFSARLTGTSYLVTSSTAAQVAAGTTILQANPWDVMDGVKVGTTSTITNATSNTYINYLFDRAPSFFDVVCYSDAASISTPIPHNLTVVPQLVIYKRRDNTGAWFTAQNVSGYSYGTLNTTAAFIDLTTLPAYTSSDIYPLISTGNIVAYLFATCAGVSKVGSYTGTGTTLQVDCGFTAGARFVLIKRADSTGDWYVWDSSRGIIAGDDPYWLTNSNAAEVTNTDYIDTYSAGFEISSTAPSAINASGGTFIFLAIA